MLFEAIVLTRLPRPSGSGQCAKVSPSTMIALDRITKRFGSIVAVDHVSFSVERGEVVGLLGPNGAGKTTSMRILTTYLAPTTGRASVAGHDLLEEPLEVRRHVGYLPESVPLYPEMRVREYLNFRAKLKDVPAKNRRLAVGRAIAKCQLRDVENRIIGQLSRGFRQRVGLAEALIHDPDILILDEPTSGLDPLQILEVRALIRELAESHTILLSTHILPEVEAVCGRVIIIARGRIALDDRLANLQQESVIIVEARGPAESIRAVLQSINGVERVKSLNQTGNHVTFEVFTRDSSDVRELISQKLVGNGWWIRHLDWQRSSLEDRFIEAVTEHSLADPRHGEAV
jgi:ABC-2 type transport system ATP-binding protein